MWTIFPIFIILTTIFYVVFSLPDVRCKRTTRQKDHMRKYFDANSVNVLENILSNKANRSLYLDKTNVRHKRQTGGGRFAEAAEVSQLKAFRLYLQLFKNLFARSYIGGAHPLHPDVPKPVVYMFKEKILDFFFPPVGERKV